MSDYQSGAELLAAFNLTTREDKLAQACRALMQELETLHNATHRQSLAENIDNPEVYCTCSYAYRMGHEALKEG